MGDGAVLTIAVNLGAEAADDPPHRGRAAVRKLRCGGAGGSWHGRLEPYSTVAMLEPP